MVVQNVDSQNFYIKLEMIHVHDRVGLLQALKKFLSLGVVLPCDFYSYFQRLFPYRSN